MRDSGSKRAHDRREPEGVRHSAQVLQFRPRERLAARAGPGSLARPPSPPAATIATSPISLRQGGLLGDFAPNEQPDDEDVNSPRRMLMNGIAAAVVMLLIGVGVWLADSIGQMERIQDCMLQGRQNCAPIEVHAPSLNARLQN
jgi:hypothetical protein